MTELGPGLVLGLNVPCYKVVMGIYPDIIYRVMELYLTTYSETELFSLI